MTKKPTSDVVALPGHVYVWQDGVEDDDPYLTVDETPDAAPAGTMVGVYELRETRRKRITHDLE